jgi:hypothetical protein
MKWSDLCQELWNILLLHYAHTNSCKTIHFNFSTRCIINWLKLFLGLSHSYSVESTESIRLCFVRDGGTSL